MTIQSGIAATNVDESLYCLLNGKKIPAHTGAGERLFAERGDNVKQPWLGGN